jgi:GxxExxY protein
MREKANKLSNEIINAAIEVHKSLGPGLLESAYETCLCHELSLRKIPFDRQYPVPVTYKGVNLDAGYRLDILVDDLVIVEIKAIKKLEPIHEAQLLTYLRLTNKWLGLLINFTVPILKQGIRRKVLG